MLNALQIFVAEKTSLVSFKNETTTFPIKSLGNLKVSIVKGGAADISGAFLLLFQLFFQLWCPDLSILLVHH